MNENCKKKKIYLKQVVFLFVLFISFFGNIFYVQAADSEPSDLTRKITITKKWEKDKPEFRPNDIVVHMERAVSEILTGPSFNIKMKVLSGSNASITAVNTTIQAIVTATDEQYEAKRASLTDTNRIDVSGEPTYMWFENGTIYIYSLADTVYMAYNSASMFRKLSNLSNISGLKDLNSSHVTDMNRMFQDSYNITDISALASWDVSAVDNMEFMFGSNYTGTSGSPMKIQSLEPLRNWYVTRVTYMGSMFKGCTDITSIEPLEGWIVSNLNDATQMFNRCESLTDFGRVFSDWNVVRVAKGKFSMMFGSVPGTLSRFDKRAGSWSSGTYNATKDAISGYNTQIQIVKARPENSYVSNSSGWVKNGDTWTYEFTVPNDGSRFRVWEEDVTDYNGSATASNPIKGVDNSATITNSNIHYREIKVNKVWNQDLIQYRPNAIRFHLLREGTLTQNSDVDATKWEKNGNTWTYTFVVFDTANYSVYEESVPKYNSDALSSNPKAVVNNTATITNTLKRYDMTLVSKVVGNMAEIEKEIEYTITIYDENGNQLPSGNLTINSTGTVATDNGSFVTKLKHGQQIVVNALPIGYQYKVVKTNTIDYDELFEMEKAGGNKQSGSSVDTGIFTLNENQTVTFFNGKREAVPTGVFIQRLPFIVLMILGMMGYLFIRYSSMKENIIKK